MYGWLMYGHKIIPQHLPVTYIFFHIFLEIQLLLLPKVVSDVAFSREHQQLVIFSLSYIYLKEKCIVISVATIFHYSLHFSNIITVFWVILTVNHKVNIVYPLIYWKF